MVLGLRRPRLGRRKEKKESDGETTPKPAEEEPKTPEPPAEAPPPPPPPATSWTDLVRSGLSLLAHNLRDLVIEASLLTVLSVLSTLLVSLVPEVTDSLTSGLASLDFAIFVGHVLYHASSHRKEADSYPTGLARKFLVPLVAAMAGGILQAAAFDDWDSLLTPMLKMSVPMVAAWALVDFLPGEIWHTLCQGFSPGPYAFRTAVFLAEAASKASGLVAGWRATQAFTACSSLDLASPVVFLSYLIFGAARGAVSVWVRTVDQFPRGGKLRQQGLLAAYSEFQRYLVISAFALWCYIATSCDIGLPRESLLRAVAEANPVKLAVLAARRAACEFVLASDPMEIGWMEKQICTEEPIKSMKAATLLSCLAYLAVVYLSKAHPERPRPRKASGQLAPSKSD